MEYSGANKLLGLEPTPPFSKDISDFIAKKKIQISNPNKDKEMTDEQYQTFLTRRNEIAEIYITQVKENGLINGKTDNDSVQKAVDILVSMANQQAKLETYKKEPVEKEPETFVKGFKPVPFKVNKQ